MSVISPRGGLHKGKLYGDSRNHQVLEVWADREVQSTQEEHAGECSKCTAVVREGVTEESGGDQGGWERPGIPSRA